MEKKTISISEQLINSIILGALLAVVIIVVGHLQQSNWSFMPQTSYSNGPIYGGSFSYSGGDRVSSCSYKCVFGSGHSADCSNMTVAEVGKESLSFGEDIKASLEHKTLFLVLAIALSVIIYTFQRVNLKVEKE